MEAPGIAQPPVGTLTLELPAVFTVGEAVRDYSVTAHAVGRVEGRDAWTAAFVTARLLPGLPPAAQADTGYAVCHEFTVPAGNCTARLGAWRGVPEPLPDLDFRLPALQMRTAMAAIGPVLDGTGWVELYLGVASADDWAFYCQAFVRMLFSVRVDPLASAEL